MTAIVAGRTIELREPTKAQVIMMHRAAMVAKSGMERAESAEKKSDKLGLKTGLDEALGGGARLLDIIERFVARGPDREWLIEELMDGSIDIEDLNPIMTAITESLDEDEPIKPVKVAKKAARGK